MSIRAVRVTLIPGGTGGGEIDVYAYPKIPFELARGKAKKLAEDFAIEIVGRLDILALKDDADAESERLQVKLFDDEKSEEEER